MWRHLRRQAVDVARVVGRNFTQLAPNRLWVADCTYVWMVAGRVYVAFVIDAYARRVVGWKVSTAMTTDLVLDAINQAMFTGRREGVKEFSGLVHHNDAGAKPDSTGGSNTRLLQ